MTKSAVIVRAGRNSTHAGWLHGGTPEFDLFVVAYQDLPPALTTGARQFVLLPGAKVAGWSSFLTRHPELFETYGQIALLDDDIVATADAINRCFAAGRTYELSLWQPSLSWRSHFSYAVCLHNPLFALRYVNFVEMMCPFFSVAHLRACLPILAMGLETGIDRLWCRIKPDWREAYAVIDAVQVEHSRPVGLNSGDQGFANGYDVVIDQMERGLNVVFRGPVAYAGITRIGRKIAGRWPMAWRATVPAAAVARSPNRRAGWFYRPVADHVRHNLTRPIANDPVAIPGIVPPQKP